MQRLAIALPLLLAMPLGHATDIGAGLSISGENGNINVGLDRETAAMASIRRNEDRMLIRLPRSFSARMMIDPELRKNGVVRESETASGKTLSIYSQRIYLLSGQNAPATTENASPSASIPSTPAGTAPGHTAPSISHAGAKPQTPATALLSAIPAFPKPDAFWMHWASAGNSPKNVSGLEAAMAELRREMQATDALDLQVGRAAAPATPMMPLAGLPPLSQNNPAGSALPPGKAPASAKGKEDPESKPVRWPDDPASANATPALGADLPRILFGLVAVLSLVAGFLKWMLPRLMERYPDFFEHLNRQSPDEGAPLSSSPLASRRGAPGRTRTDRTEALPAATHDASDPRFEILTSTPLESDKNLHLVSVQGKRLVIATTPYMVTLLREIDTETETDAQPVQHEPFPPSGRKGFMSRPALPPGTDREPPPPKALHEIEPEEVEILEDYDDTF